MTDETTPGHELLKGGGAVIGIALNIWTAVKYVQPAFAVLPNLSGAAASGITAAIALATMPVFIGIGSAALLCLCCIPVTCLEAKCASTGESVPLIATPNYMADIDAIVNTQAARQQTARNYMAEIDVIVHGCPPA